jgi:hypothetical protein
LAIGACTRRALEPFSDNLGRLIFGASPRNGVLESSLG